MPQNSKGDYLPFPIGTVRGPHSCGWRNDANGGHQYMVRLVNGAWCPFVGAKKENDSIKKRAKEKAQEVLNEYNALTQVERDYYDNKWIPSYYGLKFTVARKNSGNEGEQDLSFIVLTLDEAVTEANKRNELIDFKITKWESDHK